jgi:hypothetical protein
MRKGIPQSSALSRKSFVAEKKSPHPELVEGRTALIQRRSRFAVEFPQRCISILRPSTSSG